MLVPQDILRPFPAKQLQPQGCWLDLHEETVAFAAETELFRRVQFLFERLVGFPQKIWLERSRWTEVCDQIKVGDLLRRVNPKP